MKNKSVVVEQPTAVVSASSVVSQTKNSQQATEEQIRYAKLSQMNSKEENKIPEKIKEVSEITQKPPDIVSVALHDCNYDTQLAIQNILEGRYEDHQDEWITKAKKGKKAAVIPPTSAAVHNHTESDNKQNDIKDTDEQYEQKLPVRTKPSRGGSNANRGSSSNWRNGDRKSTDFDNSQNRLRENSRERNRGFDDRGRGRGRGRSSGRGGRSRGGFGRASYRGSNRNRGGFGRGGFSKGNNHTDEFRNGGGFGAPANDSWNNNDAKCSDEDEWDVDDVKEETTFNKKDNECQDDWGDNDEKDTGPSRHSPGGSDLLFSQSNSSINWSQVNGNESVSWADDPIGEDESEKYKHKIVDSAVLRVIPPSSTSGEVTSYQPTNDINRYMNTPSNQFPSSHQAGGLTSSLNDQAFGMPAVSASVTSSLPRSMASLQMVSGITESHKLEEEQLAVNKTQRFQQKNVGRKPQYKGPLQPVVMPRSAQLVNDDEEQYSGLEFGSGPLSPGVNKNSGVDAISTSSSTELIGRAISDDILRHSVAPIDMRTPSLMSSLVDDHISVGEQTRISSSTERVLSTTPQNFKDENVPTTPTKVQPSLGFPVTKSETMPKTPPGFRPLDQKSNTHYLGSPGRGHLGPDPIPFPSSTNISAASSPSLNVFSRPGGLGTSVTISDQKTTFVDQSLYKHQESMNGQPILSDQQRSRTDNQYLSEQQQQRLLNEQREREQTIADRKAFAEQKSLAQQKMLAAQRSHNVVDKSIDPRQNISSSDNAYNLHKKLNNSTTMPPPPGVLPPSAYATSSALPNDLSAVSTTPSKSQNSLSKSSAGPQSGGTLPLNLYPGVQHGMVYQHLHGYNSYEEIAQMHRMQMSPYPTYDVSLYPAAQVAAAAGSSREANMQNYPDAKFTRPSDEPSPVSLAQANPHVAAAAHQQAAYMNPAATGQLPYGYYYQPNMLAAAQGYPTFTTPSVYQVQQGKGGSQFQSQYQSPTHQQGSSGAPHDFNKTSYHTNLGASSQQTSQNKPQPSSSSISTSVGINPSMFKSQYNQDGKGFLGSNPSSLHTQQGVHLQNQAAALNHYLLPQNMMAHGGQVSAHLNQVDAHRGQVHPLANFSGAAAAAQQKRDSKGSHPSFWSAGR